MRDLERECPICGWKGKQFDTMGHLRLAHFDSRCPKWKSVERHRLVYLTMKDKILPDMKKLHFAPAPFFIQWMRKSIFD